jgi:hypothetical protein
MALEMTRAALEIEVTPALERRELRLKTRMGHKGYALDIPSGYGS